MVRHLLRNIASISTGGFVKHYHAGTLRQQPLGEFLDEHWHLSHLSWVIVILFAFMEHCHCLIHTECNKNIWKEALL